MRYHYFYQTSSNENKDGWIVAKDRADAYSRLRALKIKPYRLEGRNPLAWKRWAAIGVLAVAVVALACALIVEKNSEPALEAPLLSEERSQLYGDPSIVQRLSADGWRETFPDRGDAWLARHAVPGLACDCGASDGNVQLSCEPLLEVSEEDSPELAKMKRMVNCMKLELRDYLAGGGTVEDYMALCCQRLRTEKDIIADTARDFKSLRRKMSEPGDQDDVMEEWQRKNDMLRSMGLPTVVMPLEPNE